MSAVPHAITHLTLENFRNYRALTLDLAPGCVVLRGRNGAGKTNILEAISLLSPGRGLRGAKLGEMDCLHQLEASGAPVTRHPSPTATSPWVVAARVTANHQTTFIGTGRDGESAVEKRLVKINGEKQRGHAALTHHTCVQWLTPSMDQIFIEGGTARRKFFDRLVYGFAPEHAARVTAYESAMRERNRLLADRALADPYWLSVLEQQMAEHAVAITIAREEMLARLAVEFLHPIAGFPRAQLVLEGLIETWLREGDSALTAESKFAERLSSNRNMDAARRRASDGPHRSNWVVIHEHKSMEAAHCSTGEQKALLLSITLAAARARANWCNVPPILLLDEVIAHLDVDKRRELFDLIRASQIQAWMTGTDAADFKGLEGFSTSLEIDSGTVQI